MQYSLQCLLLLILGSTGVFAQSKKVIGNAGSERNYKTRFVGDKFTVLRNDGYAIIDLEGRDICTGLKAPKVGFTENFSIDYGVFFAKEKDQIVLRDLSCKIAGTGQYERITPFITDNTVVELKGTTGNTVIAYIDTLGKEIVRFDEKKYSAVIPQNKKGGITSFSINAMFLKGFLPYRDGLTPIQSDASKKFGFIDKNLKLLIPASFAAADPFSEGLAAVMNDDGNWGYINTKGVLVIPHHYSRRPSRFSAGRAKVSSKDGKYGYIDKEDKLVIPATYEHATTFYKGYALVRENYNAPVQLIDTTGKILATFPKGASYIDHSMPPSGIYGTEQGEYPFYISETLKQLVDHGKGIFSYGSSYGLADLKGNLVLDFKYTHLGDYHDGKMFAHWSSFVNNSTKHTYGIINDKGELVIEIVDSAF